MVEWTAYIDESGRDGQSDHFVIACIIGSPKTMAVLVKAIRGFKRGLAPKCDPDLWELHGQNIMHGFEPGIRLGSVYIPGRGPRMRDPTQKIAVFNSAINTVCEFDLTVFGIFVPNKQTSKKYKDKVLELTTTILFEQLEQFAQTKPVGAIRIVSDSVLPNNQQTITTSFNNSRQGNNTISKIKTSHLTEIDYIDSKNSVLIQTADLLAYVINRYRNGDDRFEKMFTKLSQSVMITVVRY